MNFDGTPVVNSNEESRLVSENITKVKPEYALTRVRVYSPPEKKTFLSEWRKWFFIGAAAALILVSAAILCVLFIPKSKDKDDLTEIIPRESIEKVIASRLKMKIGSEALIRNSFQLQEFITNGLESVKYDLDTFASYLDPEFLLAMPDDEETREIIQHDINSTLTNYLNWVNLLIEEEKILSSCTKSKSEKYVYKHKPINETGWTARMVEEVKKQRMEYLSNLEITNLMDTTLISGRIVKVSEVVECLNFLPSNTSVVTIIASVLCMDANITKNMSFAIFAHKWDFSGPIVFNLTGANAKNPDYSLKGDPGWPGGNAGVFLGVSVEEITELVVLINGGNGSHGTDGADGRNATAGLPPDFSNNRTDYICRTTNISAENIQGEVLADVNIYSDFACPTTGSPGGPGGKGGAGGAMFIIGGNRHEGFVGNNGVDGLYGRNGTNGTTSVRNACQVSAWVTEITNFFDGSIKKNYFAKSLAICSDSLVTLPVIQTKFNQLPPRLQAKPQNKTVLYNPIQLFSKISRAAEHNCTIYPIFALLEKLETSPIIFNLTTPEIMISEVEEFFSRGVSEKVLRSFLNKVTTVLNKTVDPQNQKALQYLSATVRSSISIQHTNINPMPIVNIEKYLDELIATMSDDQPGPISMTYFNVSNYYATKSAIQQLSNGMIQLSEALNGSLVDQLNSLLVEKKSDHRVLQLTLTATEATSLLLTAMSDVLTHDQNLLIYQDPLEKSLNRYEKMQLKYRHQFQATINGTYEDYICAEMFMEDCVAVTNESSIIQKELENSDKLIFYAFRKVLKAQDSLECLEALDESFKDLRQKLRRALAQDFQVGLAINLLREQVDDARKLLREAENAVIRRRDLKDIIAMADADFIFDNSEMGRSVQRLKSMLENNLLRVQYNNAYKTYQLWAFPFKESIALACPNASREELVKSIQDMKKVVATSKTTVQAHDKDIKQCDFNIKYPFYTWNYNTYKRSFVQLLEGRKIRLTAKLLNSPHFMLKQAIKFREINIAFTGPIDKHLENATVEMTHSGISHYYFRNSETVMIASPVTLEVGYGSQCTSVSCMKLMEGDALLSPFTSWTIKLKTSGEKLAVLTEYLQGSDLHLIGKGIYVSEDL